jgi:hypothetical protein
MKVSMPPEDAGLAGKYDIWNVELNCELANAAAAAAASPVQRISSAARLTVGPLVSHLRVRVA